MKNNHIWMLLFMIFLYGCEDLNEIGCIFAPENDGYYTMHQMPDEIIDISDTLWVDADNFWTVRKKCENHSYGVFLHNYVFTDLSVIKVFKIDGFYALIPVAEGETQVQIAGDFYLQRNHLAHFEPEVFTFNVAVKKDHPEEHRKLQNLSPHFISLDSVEVKPESRENWMRFKPITTPAVDYYPHGWFTGAVYNSLHEVDYKNAGEGFYRLSGSNFISFPWDSTSTEVYFYLTKRNSFDWDPEIEGYPDGVSSSMSWSFGIRSYPNDIPVHQRNFEIFGL